VRRIAATLVHYPVLDRQRAIVATAITNLDLHDIARSAHCYGLTDFFVAHPIAAQRELAQRVRRHWVDGTGARRIPDRRPPMERLHVVASLDDAVGELGGTDQVELWTTSAVVGQAPVVSFADARARLRTAGPTIMLLFGTGWGLAPEVHARSMLQLEPIESLRADGFNHLSVRAAAAITFDRLLAPARESTDE
jgi:hypothetical protein